MNCQNLPAMFLPPSLLQPGAELAWGHWTWGDGHTEQGQAGGAPYCGLRLGSLAAGGRAERGGHASSGLATEAFAWLDSAALCIHCTHLPGSHCHGNTGDGAGSGQPEHSNTENGISEMGAGLCSQGLWVPRDVAALRRSLCPGALRDVSPKQR